MFLLPQRIKRLLLALLLGLLTTVATLWLMAWLIAPDDVLERSDRDRRLVEFVRLKSESEIQTRMRREDILPPRPAPPPPPPTSHFETPQIKALEPSANPLRLDLDLTLSGQGALGDAALSGAMGFAERGLVPISGVPPPYPRRARMMRIEGMVELEFTITTDGSVRDIEVIASENGEHFERAAIAALQRWRFRPKLVGGRAVEQRAIQTFDFRLDP